MNNVKEMMTATELAKLLRLQPDTIRVWTREGIIPAIRVTGKVIRFDFAEVERALRMRSDNRLQKGGVQ